MSIICFVLFFVFIQHSFSDPDDCQSWIEYCKMAKESPDKYFQCYIDHDQSKIKDSVIFYYETHQQTSSWDEARDSCSQKFSSSPLADLVQLSDTKKRFAEDMLRKIGESDIDIPTNGVCCMRRMQRNDIEKDCEWLATEESIEDQPSLSEENKCIIFMTKFDGNKLIRSSPLESHGSFIGQYLCGYNLPVDCRVPQELIPTDDFDTTNTTTNTTTIQSTTARSQSIGICGQMSVAIISAKLEWLYNSYVIVYARNQSDPVNLPYGDDGSLICKTETALNSSSPNWSSNCPDTGKLWSVNTRLIFEIWDHFDDVFLGAISITISDILTDDLDNIPATLPFLKGHGGELKFVVGWKRVN